MSPEERIVGTVLMCLFLALAVLIVAGIVRLWVRRHHDDRPESLIKAMELQAKRGRP